MFIYRLFFFVALEVAILAILLLLLAARRLYVSIRDPQEIRLRKQASGLILDFMQTGKNASLFPRMPHFILLEALESFNNKLKGTDWKMFARKLAETFLLGKARRRYRSLFWRKRNFAARVFALAPLSLDEPKILRLVHDRKFLVRAAASLAAIELESEEGIQEILRQMSKTTGYAHYFYRDLFEKASQKTLEIASRWITNPDLCAACLEILGGKTVPFPLPFLHELLNHPDLAKRRLSLKILLSNPHFESEELWHQLLKDPDEEIRSMAAIGLSRFAANPPVSAIQEFFTTAKSPKERIKAAAALKKMGVLDPEQYRSDPAAYGLACYAMEFE